MERFDVVVVGTGAIGAATTYQLASNGTRVLGIDRFNPPHSFGSSHGDTRITREVYNSGPQIELVRRSHQLWGEIERAADVTLKMTTGGVFIGSTASDATWADDITARARSSQIEHETLSAVDLRERFPAFRLSGTEPVVFEPNAGVLRPEKCISSQLGLAQRAGAVLHVNETVVGIEETRTCVVVRTDQSDYEADRVVVTTGAWIGHFVSPDLASNIHSYRQVLYWYDIDRRSFDALTPGNFPVFVWQRGSDSRQMFYGFPAVDGPSGGLKIATEQYEVVSEPDDVQREVSDREIETMYYDFACHIEGLLQNVVKASTCMYTVTADWEYILDWAPNSDRIFIASPCMGRGFKHSAALGESIAQLVTSDSSDIDLTAYRIGNRFSP